MLCVVLVTSVLVSVSLAKLPLPPYIKPCARSDPNINQCAVQHGNDAIPHLVKGDRKYKVPPMDPLVIPEVTVAEGGARQVGLSFTLKDCKVYGLKEGRLEKADIDFSKQHNRFEFRIPRMQIIGQYELTGRILLLPISGKGDCNITLDDTYIVYDEFYTLEPRDGSTHVVIGTHPTDVTAGNMHIEVTNLFGGDKLLGAQMNQFLNENWRDVFKELSPAVFNVMSEVTLATTEGIHKAVPFDSIFPETLPP